MNFLNLLARQIVTIYVEGDKIVFAHDEAQVREEPLIRVADDGKVIDVGRAAETTEGGRLIRLFARSGEDDAAIRVFCRYMIALALQGVSFRRPRVEVVEPTFRSAFGLGSAESLVAILQADGFDAGITDAR